MRGGPAGEGIEVSDSVTPQMVTRQRPSTVPGNSTHYSTVVFSTAAGCSVTAPNGLSLGMSFTAGMGVHGHGVC